nr:hypothetical protein [Faecalibaculum rodentium]
MRTEPVEGIRIQFQLFLFHQFLYVGFLGWSIQRQTRDDLGCLFQHLHRFLPFVQFLRFDTENQDIVGLQPFCHYFRLDL